MMRTHLLLLFVLVPACATERIDLFDEVHAGMSKEEVRAILGKPSSTYTREIDELGRVVRVERWQYGDTPGSLATGALFSEHPSNRVWAVFFDENHEVLEVMEPDWTPKPRDLVVPSTIPSRNR